MTLWIGLAVSVAMLLVVAQRSLYVAMFAAAISLGLITLSPGEFLHQVYLTFTDPSILSLGLVVATIAMIGGTLEESGGMKRLVENLRIGKRPFLAFSPALLGMLPMPGGALLSAPMVEQGGSELESSTKAVLNVWFRHILFFIYPLATSLIASAKIAGLEVYDVVPYLFPFFVLSFVVGYYFFLRSTSEKLTYEREFSLRGLLVPLAVILVAPALDFLIKTFINPEVSEYATLVGVATSFAAAWAVSKYSLDDFKMVARKMEPWNFALIIFGMFTFLNVFIASGAPELLAKINMPLWGLLVGIGFVLGLITGRIQAPASIVIPIFLARTSYSVMPAASFAVAYFSIFLGYVISPIHPCVSVSMEYFDTSLRQYVRKLALPTILCLIVAVLAAIFWIR
ncbi:MAG: DUF401 family protein [Candidatus Acetothermia bacterium]